MSEVRRSRLRVVPFAPGIGADVEGVDVRHIGESDFVEVLAAWHAHGVLRFRGQSLDKDGLIAFSERFGELDQAPVNISGKPWIPTHPQLAVMSNVISAGAPIGSLGYGEAVWHTDMSYKEVTPSAAILYGVEVTEVGGETGFVNMYRAYDTLPPGLRAEIAGRSIKHDASRNSAGELRKGFAPNQDPRRAPGAVHPIVIEHPVTRRPALFLGRRPGASVVDMAPEQSESLLDSLWAHATDETEAWFQRWQVGDLLIWDNRCVMHKRTAFDPSLRRYLLRTQIKGARPQAAPCLVE